MSKPRSKSPQSKRQESSSTLFVRIDKRTKRKLQVLTDKLNALDKGRYTLSSVVSTLINNSRP
jgi:hypothetical protein